MLLKVTDIVATNVSYGPCVVCPFLSPFDPKHPHPLTSSFVSVDDTTFKKTRGTSIQPHTSILLSLSLILSPSFALSRTQKRTHSHSAHLTRTNAGLFHSRFVDSEGKENSGAVSSARNAGFRRIFKVTSFLYSSIRRVHRKSPQLMVKNILSEKRTSLGAKIKYHAYAVTISYKQFC